MSSTTLAQKFWPAVGDLSNISLRNLVLVVAGSMIVAAAAHISVPMVPVPMTLQTLAVLAIGAVYGSRLGAATLALYALEGAAGLPVFAPTLKGYPSIMGPTGGYVIGFILAAGLVGYLAERGWDKSINRLFLATLAGAAILYVPGIAWLSSFISFEKAVTLGMVPFLMGDVVKAAIVAGAIPAVWALTRNK
jgi:biotin transport system substrate-specific component